MVVVVVVTLLALAFSAVSVHAQVPICSPYNVSLAFCNDIMVDDAATLDPREVFSITNALTQEAIAAQLVDPNSTSSVFRASAMPYPCAVAYLNLVCSSGYQACYPDPRGFTTYRRVCQSVCDTFVASCNAFFNASVGAPLPDNYCLQGDPNSPTVYIPRWPETAAPSVLPSAMGTLITPDVPCYPASPKVLVEYPCPDGTVFAPELATQESPLACQNTCPPAYTSTDDKEVTFIVCAVGSWISFPCFLYMLLTYTIFRDNRMWPRRIFIYVVISSMLFNLAWMMPVFVQWQDEVCNTDSFYCILQSILLSIGAQWATSWWCCLAINMWYVVFWKAHTMKTKKTPTADVVLEVCFNIFAWGMGIVTMIVITAAQKWEGGETAGVLVPFCLFEHSPSFFPWVALYMFFAFYALVVTICMSMVVFTINSISSKTKRGIMVRMILYAVYFLFTVVLFIITQAINTANSDGFKEDVVEWYRCTVTWQQDCDYPTPPVPGGLITAAFFFPSLSGVILFLTMGCSTVNLRKWKRAFRDLKDGNGFLAQNDDDTMGSTTRTSASGVSSMG
eukprot:CAMPEP_0177651030 /NCGR_PEP_ID=MMETSP0447-20121125/12295_1 /TAXON_ID=0 /ORGANISM="Stygamoeba regulata, Strain BSH-02190019" /LENGTH=562 /DNA_ID=CAMNT_0019154013 /DNA_START=127 /DNA_END=1815 /DNA_ORIENTATION=+